MFSKCIGFGYHFVMIKTKTKSFKHQMWGLKDIRYRFPVDVGAKKFPVRFCLFWPLLSGNISQGFQSILKVFSCKLCWSKICCFRKMFFSSPCSWLSPVIWFHFFSGLKYELKNLSALLSLALLLLNALRCAVEN